MKTALICGIAGQDGAYLTRLLLDKGYRIVGTSRDAQISNFSSLSQLGVRDRVEVLSMALNAVIWERFGSISQLVFSLPVLRILPRRLSIAQRARIRLRQQKWHDQKRQDARKQRSGHEPPKLPHTLTIGFSRNQIATPLGLSW